MNKYTSENLSLAFIRVEQKVKVCYRCTYLNRSGCKIRLSGCHTPLSAKKGDLGL